MKAQALINIVRTLVTGAKDMAGHPGERITEGLDGLRDRLAAYAQMGARFAKWRAVLAVGDGIPSRGCIEAKAQALPAMPRWARKPDWFPSSNRKSLWTASIPWSGALK
jgi:fructose-bisphosphate aldolase class 1